MPTSAVPYYKRELSSFDDQIITRQRPTRDGNWHAVLDCGFDTHVSDPDFSPSGYGANREQAAANSAFAIRQDAVGIGKFAPHDVLVPGYDLSFRLMRHWDLKERFRVLGIDPNEVMLEVKQGEWDWGLSGSWINSSKASRHLEFTVRLLLAEAERSIENGVDADEAAERIINELRSRPFHHNFLSARPMNETWIKLSERLEAMIASAEASLDSMASPRP